MPNPVNQAEPSRIQFLDALRGVAIGMVVLFHAYYRWADLVPFGHRFASNPLFANGWLGVELFFMISGFVIFMTLERCRTLVEFAWRRWLRLFPAMLACSLFIFATSSFFWERPAGQPSLRDLLPGLTFIQPDWWARLLGSPQGCLEGAFWTLFIEAKFYAVGGAAFFLLGEEGALAAIAALFFAAMVGEYANVPWLQHGASILDASYYGWFASGALFYRWYRLRTKMTFGLAMAIALLSPAMLGHLPFEAVAVAYCIVLLFAIAVLSRRVQRLLSISPLIVLGFVSYPLYLLHENLLISLMIKMGRWIPWIPGLLNPVIPFAVVFGIAWLVATYVEPWLRSRIRYLVELVIPALGRSRDFSMRSAPDVGAAAPPLRYRR